MRLALKNLKIYVKYEIRVSSFFVANVHSEFVIMLCNVHIMVVVDTYRCIIPYFTVEAPTCFDSYNQSRLGVGGGYLNMLQFNRGSAQLCPPNSSSYKH